MVRLSLKNRLKKDDNFKSKWSKVPNSKPFEDAQVSKPFTQTRSYLINEFHVLRKKKDDIWVYPLKRGIFWNAKNYRPAADKFL